MEILFLILFEITRDELWRGALWLAAAFFFVLVSAGASATAIKNTREVFFVPLYVRFVKPVFSRGTQIDELLKKVDDLTETNRVQTESIRRIELEVKTNGGSSLKDAVGRIERDVSYATAKLRHLDEAADAAIFEMDEAGNLIFANAALCKMLNADDADLTDRKWIHKVVPEQRQRVKQEWADAFENKCNLDSSQMIFYNERSFIKVRVQATPHINQKDELRGFFGKITKISD
ncbi:MAG TPA: PAS domain-containing protein [Pyrinomonadaceae bacterium]|nr:PAS domain-containing protein [Pyrinomonadaceae bacterium]